MKIILSRKGFDSQYGGVASPILPDGTVLSFPIPSRAGRPLTDIESPAGSLHTLVSDLSQGGVPANARVHLDPDLWMPSVPRVTGWRPSLGQVGSAQRHLEKQGVREGDVFLFFGWFRRAEKHQGRWRYVSGAPNVHSLFGWLQVGEIIRLTDSPKIPAWLADHPHVTHADQIGMFNTLYVASQRLRLDGVNLDAAGAGVFSRWSNDLQLTAPGASRSVWRMPKWMAPEAGRPSLSYHGSLDRWSIEDGQVILKSVAKGQEFVREVDTPDGRRWLGSLVATHA